MENHSDDDDYEEPEVELIKWLIKLQFPDLNVNITADSLRDDGHLELIKIACNNVSNFNLTPNECYYFGNKYPLIHDYLNTN